MKTANKIANPRSIITLTTDFGLDDPFVGVMKGVILTIAPATTIVDLTHGIQAHDVLEAALVVRSSYSFFPPGTIHVVVVDPGVGSSRRPILLITDRYFFIAPDNGVLSPIFHIEKHHTVFHLTAERYFLNPVSNTFHGRDIFSPVAAWLSKGIDPVDLGKIISDPVELELPLVKNMSDSQKIGTILRVDTFGNLITNVTPSDLTSSPGRPSSFIIEIRSRQITRCCLSYSEAAPGELFAIWGSSGLLEISANRASAAEILQAGKNQEFTLHLHHMTSGQN